MKKIYIWGSGKGITSVFESLNFDKVNVVAVIDNDPKKIGTTIGGFEIVSPDRIDKDVDYIVIAAKIRFPNIKKQLCEMGYEETKILCYYDIKDVNFNGNIDFINYAHRLFFILSKQLEQEILRNRNCEYEIADKIRKDEYQFPIIKSSFECLKKIKEERLSLCRFGDGEFEMILLRERPCFQSTSETLSKRLKSILVNNNSNLLTAIAANYGALDDYTENAANEIRKYLSPEIRKEHMKLLDLKKEYYDAYVSRPYIMYKNKDRAVRLFNAWKEIWAGRDVVIIEGKYTRNGVKNDLFKDVRSVERVLCSIKNVWDDYDKIYSYIVQHISKEKLILITLGPTATVLAYDLSELGYQAIDIGQVDNEYEWYCRAVDVRVDIDYKYVAECGEIGHTATDVQDESYSLQILTKIE